MRFITEEIINPALVTAYEEGMILSREQDLSEDFIWLWKHPKVIYLTKNATINHIGEEYVREVGYPINRSGIFEGTVKSAVIAGDDYSILCSIKNPTFDIKRVLYKDLWQKIASDYGVVTEFVGNDIIVRGTTRKLFGMVYREVGEFHSGHCMFSTTTPDVDLSKVFLIRDDVRMFNPIDRITDIQKETGIIPKKEEIVEKVKNYLDNLGIIIAEDSISKSEQDIISSLEKKHLSTEWITYERIKPDFN